MIIRMSEFRKVARDSTVSKFSGRVSVARQVDVQPVAVGTGSRILRFCFSDETVDRAGDIVKASGWRLDSYKANPIALACHNSTEIGSVIGRGCNVGLVGRRLMGDIEFMPADINPLADMAFRMLQGGWLKAVSVGFEPIDWIFSDEQTRTAGIIFVTQALMEISVVPIPANPNALIEARSAGVDLAPLRQWTEANLDEGLITIPRKELEALRRAVGVTPTRTSAARKLRRVAAIEHGAGPTPRGLMARLRQAEKPHPPRR